MMKRYLLATATALGVCWALLVTLRVYAPAEPSAPLGSASAEGGDAGAPHRLGSPNPVPACVVAGTVLTCNGQGTSNSWQAGGGSSGGGGGLPAEGGAMTPFEVDNSGIAISYPATGYTTAETTTVTTTGSNGSIYASAAVALKGGTVDGYANAKLTIDSVPVDFGTVTMFGGEAGAAPQTIITLTGAVVGTLAAGSHTVAVSISPSAAMSTPNTAYVTIAGVYSGPAGGGGGAPAPVVQTGSVTLGTDGGPTCVALPIPLAPSGGNASTYVGLCNLDIIVQEVGVGTGGQTWCAARINLIGFNEAGVINGGTGLTGYGGSPSIWSSSSYVFLAPDGGCGDAGPTLASDGGTAYVSTCYPPGIDAGHLDLTTTTVTVCNN